jgi:uncharacterized protein (TIGR03437 family)
VTKTLALATLSSLLSFAATDPRLTFSSRYPVLLTGNTISGSINAMATDAAGNLYIAGFTRNAGFPVTANAAQHTIGGGSCVDPVYNPLLPASYHPCSDGFVMKLDPAGNTVFSTFLGGTGDDTITHVAADADGNVYVAGIAAAGFPVTAGSPFAGSAGYGTFVAKLNAAGTRVAYSYLIPGVAASIAMTVDAKGNLYFAASASGFTASAGGLSTNGTIAAGKLDPTGTRLLAAARFGGTSQLTDVPNGIALDASGNIYLTGSTDSPDFPVTPGAVQAAAKSTSTGFVAKLSGDWSAILYATYLGGSSVDSGSDIRVDSSGNAYVAGSTQSFDFPVTNRNSAATYATTRGGFLTKIAADGRSILYSTYVSDLLSPGNADAFGIPTAPYLDVDAAGNAYLAGGAWRGLAVSPHALRPCMGGSSIDAYVAQVSPLGKLTAATYLGGAAGDRSTAVAAMPDGSVAVAGYTESPDFPTTAAAPSSAPYFVTRLRIADDSLPIQPCLTATVESSASGIEGPIAPGELVTLRGYAFGPEQGIASVADSSGFTPTSVAGVQVFFDDVAAPILYAQSGQINVQAPWELQGKQSTQLRVRYQGADSATAPLSVFATQPDFFRQTGSKLGCIVNQDGTLNSADHPAKPGDIVSIYGTGGGPYSPPLSTGASAPMSPLSYLTQDVTVKIRAALPAKVLYAGATPTAISGVFQINFQVPEDIKGLLPPYTVDVTIGGRYTDPLNTAEIAVQ